MEGSVDSLVYSSNESLHGPRNPFLHACLSEGRRKMSGRNQYEAWLMALSLAGGAWLMMA